MLRCRGVFLKVWKRCTNSNWTGNRSILSHEPARGRGWVRGELRAGFCESGISALPNMAGYGYVCLALFPRPNFHQSPTMMNGTAPSSVSSGSSNTS